MKKGTLQQGCQVCNGKKVGTTRIPALPFQSLIHTCAGTALWANLEAGAIREIRNYFCDGTQLL